MSVLYIHAYTTVTDSVHLFLCWIMRFIKIANVFSPPPRRADVRWNFRPILRKSSIPSCHPPADALLSDNLHCK